MLDIVACGIPLLFFGGIWLLIIKFAAQSSQRRKATEAEELAKHEAWLASLTLEERRQYHLEVLFHSHGNRILAEAKALSEEGYSDP